MEEDILERLDNQVQNTQANQALSVICVLSYVGNGLWVLLFGLAFLGIASAGAEIMDRLYEIPQFEGMEAAALLSYIKMAIGLLLLLCTASLVGAILAHRKKLAGVIIYGVTALIWAIMFLSNPTAFSIIIGLIPVAFTAVMAFNYNK